MKARVLDDCKVGDRALTSGRTITETDVVMFAALSGDWQGVHTDSEAARVGPFGERVAHGMLTLVTGLNLLFRHGGFGNGLLPDGPVIIARIDNVRFLSPVHLGDTVHLDCEISDLNRQGQQGIVDLRFRILNQRNDPVLSGRVTVVVDAGTSNPAEGGQPNE